MEYMFSLMKMIAQCGMDILYVSQVTLSIDCLFYVNKRNKQKHSLYGSLCRPPTQREITLISLGVKATG